MKPFLLITFFALCTVPALCQSVRGRVLSADGGEALPGAAVIVRDRNAWCVSDANGRYELSGIGGGEVTAEVVLLGYARQTIRLNLANDTISLDIRMKADNLKLDEVVVTAQRGSEIGTSYSIDRTTLEHSQSVNISDISALLPGGKTPTGDNNLASSDNRLALRAESNESGNAAFGTAVEVDGIRLGNNANAEETSSIDTRSLSTTNVASVEVVTGIPSVEHGDLSNGMVRIRTLSGQTPLAVELMMSPNTKQASASKGLRFSGGGTLNASYDFTRSVSDLASPHKAYLRNAMQLKYSRVVKTDGGSLAFGVNASGNIGGLNTDADPDAFVDTYTKQHDRSFTLGANVRWLIAKPWITGLEAQAAVSYADRQTRTKTNESSASMTPNIHATEEGYYIGSTYDDDPDASIILTPAGYWYLTKVSDNKPLAVSAKIKANLNKTFGETTNTVMIGAEWQRTSNEGRGVYYTDMRYAPTWREYRYDDRPAMNTVSAYAEDKLIWPIGQMKLTVVAGLRSDVASVEGSDYGTVCSFSPRANVRLSLVEHGRGTVRDLSLHGGWGRAVKLPSFQVLYPDPSYADVLAFTAATQADGTTFYAYYTHPETPRYNRDLKWQYANQTEIGFDMNLSGVRMTVSAYRNKTYRPYLRALEYTGLTYSYTSVAAAEACTIDAENRIYSIDQSTGIVTVTDASGEKEAETLEAVNRTRLMSNAYYTNGSPVVRTGIDFIIDMPKIKAINTVLRVDGKYYHFKSLDQTMMQWAPSSQNGSDGEPFKYVGYYVGVLQSSVPDAGSSASTATVANGREKDKLNLNLTVTTHIPRLRLVVSAKLESTLMDHSRYLCKNTDGVARGYASTEQSDYFSTDTDVSAGDKYVVVYPRYYADFSAGGELLPFAERFAWARDNDSKLYADLRSLVLQSSTRYYMNKCRVSAYCSANLRVTKEIGDHVDLSFYAINFFNNMASVEESNTRRETTLYDSSYIPQFYYGMTMKVKL